MKGDMICDSAVSTFRPRAQHMKIRLRVGCFEYKLMHYFGCDMCAHLSHKITRRTDGNIHEAMIRHVGASAPTVWGRICDDIVITPNLPEYIPIENSWCPCDLSTEIGMRLCANNMWSLVHEDNIRTWARHLAIACLNDMPNSSSLPRTVLILPE